jgi:predicted AAA+ superfamily ATPase
MLRVTFLRTNVIMKRLLLADLESWQKSSDRKPLVIMGARQVGKTYLLRSFAEANYQNYIYLNFDRDKSLNTLFEADLNPIKIIQTLMVYIGKEILPEKTLIIFDEVQECPNALSSLKYFNEDANEYHICAAGSLLGVKLLNTNGFPVGKVNIKYLYPFDFREFLLAVNENSLFQVVDQITLQQTIPDILHQKLFDLFKNYMMLGGMPEVINTYIKTPLNWNMVREKQNEILDAYKLDFAKHAPENQIMRISQVWQSIPGQLAKENKKFVYSVIRTGARALEFEQAIQWLVEAELLSKVLNISLPNSPLSAYSNFHIFKLYMLDVGLYAAISNLDPRVMLQKDDLLREFKGTLTETYVAQELRIKRDLYYWTSEGQAEVDFIIEYAGYVIPLEVKSGVSTKSKSLQVYRNKYEPPLVIKATGLNLKLDGKVLNVPLYLLSKLDQILDGMSF